MSAGNPTLSSPSSLVASKPKYEFFKVIQKYIEEGCSVVDVPEHVRTILRQPKKEIIVNFPDRMDDGSLPLFKGYRIQHNSLLGPYKGGMRFHENVTLD